jgi:hypothetical protein
VQWGEWTRCSGAAATTASRPDTVVAGSNSGETTPTAQLDGATSEVDGPGNGADDRKRRWWRLYDGTAAELV